MKTLKEYITEAKKLDINCLHWKYRVKSLVIPKYNHRYFNFADQHKGDLYWEWLKDSIIKPSYKFVAQKSNINMCKSDEKYSNEKTYSDLSAEWLAAFILDMDLGATVEELIKDAIDNKYIYDYTNFIESKLQRKFSSMRIKNDTSIMGSYDAKIYVYVDMDYKNRDFSELTISLKNTHATGSAYPIIQITLIADDLNIDK